jgi:BirA family biotin operon repressor/biotin-[acetyl-CoA-carboxylase] ligase
VRNSFDSGLVNAALITLPGAWREVDFHPSLGSTNEAIRSLSGAAATRNEPYDGQPLQGDDGLWRVVLTDHQTGGRGRLGRGWQVPDRAAISMSVTVPVAGPEELPWVPLLAGVALSRAIVATATAVGSPLTARLKWPNDVLIAEAGDRKVSGILCEYVPAGRTPTVVIGTGINVDQTQAELPVPTATSLALAGAPVSREDLVVAYLGELGRLFAPEATGEREAGTAAYRSLCATVGQHVRIHLPGGATVDGDATGIGEGAELLVSTAEGERAFAAGDVVHVRRPGGGLA